MRRSEFSDLCEAVKAQQAAPWPSCPADELHLRSEILPEFGVRRIAKLGQIALEFCLEELVEFRAVHNDPPAVVLQEDADRPQSAVAAYLGLMEDAAPEIVVKALGNIRRELSRKQRPLSEDTTEGALRFVVRIGQALDKGSQGFDQQSVDGQDGEAEAFFKDWFAVFRGDRMVDRIDETLVNSRLHDTDRLRPVGAGRVV